MRRRVALLALAVALLVVVVIYFPHHTDPIEPSPAEPPAERPAPREDPPPLTAPDPPVETTGSPTVRVPGVAIRGRVIDGAGAPVPGAIVFLSPSRRTGTDDEGRFEVFAAEPGPAALAVSHHAFLAAHLLVSAPADDVEIRLERGLDVRGQVTFPDGKPVPAIGVQGGGRSVETGEDGRYALSGLDPGEIEVSCPIAGEKRTVLAGDSAVDFVAKRHVVRLGFVDEEGRPVERAGLWVRGYLDGKEYMTLAGGVDEHGVAIVVARPGAELQISPSAPGYDETVTTRKLEGELRLHEIEIVIRRQGEGGTLQLGLLDEAGRPIRRVLLSLCNEAGSPLEGFYDREVLLDEDGRGRVEVPSGKLGLRLSTAGKFASLTGYGLPYEEAVTVEPGRTLPVEVTILDGGRVRVTVKDATGEIVAPGRLDLLDEQGARIAILFIRERARGWTTALDEPAPALLGRPVPPGRYRVVVKQSDQRVATKEVTISRGVTEELEIVIGLDR